MLQSCSEIIETTAKNRVICVSTSNVKLFQKRIQGTLKEYNYICKKIYGYLVPSPPCIFFERFLLFKFDT